MLSAESFQTSSLRSLPEGESITRILAASIHAVEPGAAVERFVRREGDILTSLAGHMTWHPFAVWPCWGSAKPRLR